MSKFALRSVASLIVLTFLFSCENEYSEVGTGLINSIEVQPDYENKNIVAYSEKHNSIQAIGFRNLFLGKYDDPFFGQSEAKVLTQLSLTQSSPNFRENPIVDSVVMTLPLFSREVQQGEYELDSVYGNGSFKLNIYQSNQFLRELDPGPDGDFQNRQIYFTDQLNDFRSNIESTPIVTSQVIKPSELTKQVILAQRLVNGDIDSLRLSPRIRIKMPVQYFEDKIINASNSEVLASNNAFKNYLRGFLIEAEQQQETEFNMTMFDFQNGDANITIYYKNETEQTNDEGEVTTSTSYSRFALSFDGIKMNLYENEFNVDLSNQNTTEGEENLYLKGGVGSSAVIKLFTGPDLDGNGISDELEELREKQWLINEASLDLYLNEDEAPSPKNRNPRVFLFNIDDELVLEDYTRDPTASESPSLSRQVHLGILREDENGDPFYRIRITYFINNLLNNDADNVRLGLYVSSNINESNVIRTRDSEQNVSENVHRGMLGTPRGVVIHGNRSSNEAKKLKLRIIYTETN